MFNLSFISKKNFLGFLNKVNFLLIDILNNLKFSNLKRLTRLFLIDKRVIITIIIIFFSVFIHLSTPAFYKDSFVKEIIRINMMTNLISKSSLVMNYIIRFFLFHILILKMQN